MARDDNNFAIPSVNVIDNEKLTDTYTEPIPPGGSLPQLNLADSSGFDVASGQSFQCMPTPVKPDIVWPTLSGSPDMGGYDSSNPSPPAPNLAGVGGGVDGPADSIQPDYGQPDFASLNVGLQPYNLNAGINYAYGGEFEPDPMLPDLNSYNQPQGLDIHNLQGTGDQLFRPDPYLNDLISYEVPGGVHVMSHPLDPDPSVPDLQNPQLSQDVTMQDRPGDMADGAMDVLRNDATYNATKGVAYDMSYMTQPGSTTRGRRMDMLNHGLDGDM